MQDARRVGISVFWKLCPVGGPSHRELLLDPGIKISLGANTSSPSGFLQASVFPETHLSIRTEGYGRQMSPNGAGPATPSASEADTSCNPWGYLRRL